MAEIHPPPTYRSGFVALAGRPNTGKSTLANALLGQDVAAVSPRPQTTRRRQLAILTLPEAQMILVDAPGLHRPIHRLGEALNRRAEDVVADADVVLAVCDVSQPLDEQDERVAAALQRLAPGTPQVLALNKVDLVPPSESDARARPYLDRFPSAEPRLVSALRGDGLVELRESVVHLLPAGPPYYPADEVTDTYERDLAGDLIHAAALGLLRDEVPHSLAVRVDEYRERDERSAYVAATLLVERDSQKGIVIGRGGTMLKRIGTQARGAIEGLTGRKVFLDLQVRVLPHWRDDPEALRGLGFAPPARRGKPR